MLLLNVFLSMALVSREENYLGYFCSSYLGDVTERLKDTLFSSELVYATFSADMPEEGIVTSRWGLEL